MVNGSIKVVEENNILLQDPIYCNLLQESLERMRRLRDRAQELDCNTIAEQYRTRIQFYEFALASILPYEERPL